MSGLPPVIAIDGPSGSGKGTVAQAVAEVLHFHYLDSGALYRLVALAADRRGIPLNEENRLAELASSLDVKFVSSDIILSKEKVTDDIRSEACGRGASLVGALALVRQALLRRQQEFRQAPGLVADGRDMATVVFPDARLKIYLTATAKARAERRHKQLKQKGITANITVLLQDLQDRDARDESRSVAPLKQSPDARLLDTTAMSIADAVKQVLEWYRGLEIGDARP